IRGDPRGEVLLHTFLHGEEIAPLEALHDTLAVRQRVAQAALPRRDADFRLLARLPDLVEKGDELGVPAHGARELPLGELHRLRVRGEALRAPRIPGHEDEIARAGALGRDLEPVLRLEGDVLLRERHGLARGGDICAVERPVARVARPLPVVRFAAEVADTLRGRIDEPHVLDLHLRELEVLQAVEERRHAAAQAVLLAGGRALLEAPLDYVVPRAVGELRVDLPGDLVRDFLDRTCDVHARAGPGGQLLIARGGEKAVLHEVLLRGGVELESTLHAVVVRDDEPVRRHERGATAAEGHDGSHGLAREIGEGLRVAAEAHRLQAFGELRNLLRHPHAFVRTGGGGQKSEAEDEAETGFQEFLLEKMDTRAFLGNAGRQTRNYAPAERFSGRPYHRGRAPRRARSCGSRPPPGLGAARRGAGPSRRPRALALLRPDRGRGVRQEVPALRLRRSGGPRPSAFGARPGGGGRSPDGRDGGPRDERRRAPPRRPVHARLRGGGARLRDGGPRRARDRVGEPAGEPHAHRKPSEPLSLRPRGLHAGLLLRRAGSVGARDGGGHAAARAPRGARAAAARAP